MCLVAPKGLAYIIYRSSVLFFATSVIFNNEMASICCGYHRDWLRKPYAINLQSPGALVSFQTFYPLVWVFLSAWSFFLFDASINTGIVAIMLRPASTHAIISMIFSSWHSVNPPRICPTPWRQRITPHNEWMRTPDTIQRIVEMTKNIYCRQKSCASRQWTYEHTVWNIEWKIFCAQCSPMYTEHSTIILALEKIKKPRRYFSVFEDQVCVFCRYW